MTMISTGEATMRLLARYGVDMVFGIPGVHTLEFCRGLAEGSPIRHIQARNELGAGFMADGYARSTGKPGVVLTVSGPGVTNAVTALGQSYADSLPLLLISAEASTQTLGKGWGVLHEVTDLNAVTSPLTALSVCAKQPEDIPEAFEKAFAIFASKRPRPVHLAVPIDVLAQLVEDDWQAASLPSRPQPDAKAIRDAAKLLLDAERPIILVGGGAKDAEITSIAERLGAIVISSIAGKGIVPDHHPFNLGGSISRPESQQNLSNADVVFAIGTELAETDSYLEKLNINGKIIRVDIDPRKMSDRYTASVEILSDASLAATALLRELGQGEPKHNPTNIVAETLARIPETLNATETKHLKLLATIREALPDNAIVMADSCQVTYTGSFAFPVAQPGRWHYASGYCALGFALPNAIGAKLAQPDVPVVAIAGDGGSMFTIQELLTAAEQKLPIPLIIWHNDGYQQIRDDMRNGNFPRIGVDGLAPDFCALSKAMHCDAREPQSAEELMSDIKEALNAQKPTVIVVREAADWLD